MAGNRVSEIPNAAKSGAVSDYGQSWMETTVQGGGIIRFYWKVSSQINGDFLEFFIDGFCQDRISGDTGWQAPSYNLYGSGTHILKWRYIKNSYGSDGDDCGWVDYVQTPTPVDWTTITYTYDFAGRRIAKAYDGATVTKYLYDGGQILAEYDGSNNLLHKYIHGPGVDQPICMIDVNDANATYYYHFDGLGSVVALSDDSGDTVEVYEYSVFGQVAASDPNHPNRFLFTGREFDSETGLYYYRARYYNPYIGRFMQEDPAKDGMNPCTYCVNNPAGYVDPWGLAHDPYNLPWNTGPEINVQVAFYDGSDPGGPECSNGDQMEEDADDFTYVKDGLTYRLYFDMGADDVKDVSRFIAEKLTYIAQRGYHVTDVFFYDHCTTDKNGDFALEFGDEVWGPGKMASVANWINFRYRDALPADCTLNFRHCLVASNIGYLKNLAAWFNRDVTGCAGTVADHDGVPKVYDFSAPEIPGPDYYFTGDLIKATPAGKTEVLWPAMVPVDPFWQPGVYMKNPEHNPY